MRLMFWKRKKLSVAPEWQRIGKLIVMYNAGAVSPDQRKELDIWICKDQRNKELFDKLTDPVYLAEKLALFDRISKKDWE